jgi:predicted regulator of Ras-like GTPase activity (Roadblock/LC7/MglB family)
MPQSVLEGLCASRSEITGAAYVEASGLAIASAGARAHEARKAGTEALGMLKRNERLTLEAEQGWMLAERLEGGDLLLVLTDAAPNLGGILAEVQRCCSLLSR